MKFGSLEFRWQTASPRVRVLLIVGGVFAGAAWLCWQLMMWVASDAFQQPSIVDALYRHAVMVKGTKHFITDQQLYIYDTAKALLWTMGAVLVCLWFVLRRFARPNFPTADRKDGRSRWTE